jgi:NADPH:quinone reductase-like Zn-dependent oxidoreductase
MKALVLTSYGDPETCIEYQTVPEPEAPGAGEVLVQLGFAPINFSDILVARGLYPVHPDLVVLDDDEAPIKVGEVLGESRPRLALDAVGGEASGRLIKLLGPERTFVSYAAPSCAPMAISPFDVIFNDLLIRGFSTGYPRFTSKIPRAIDEAAKMIVDGRVHVPITATYPLEEFKAAIAHALRGGKILLSATA